MQDQVTAATTLHELTVNIQEPATKPYLRPVLDAAMQNLGHTKEEASQALAWMYEPRSVQ